MTQAKLPEWLEAKTLKTLPVGQGVIISPLDLWVDENGLMWLKGKTTNLYTIDDVGRRVFSPLVVTNTSDGFMVDIAMSDHKWSKTKINQEMSESLSLLPVFKLIDSSLINKW